MKRNWKELSNDDKLMLTVRIVVSILVVVFAALQLYDFSEKVCECMKGIKIGILGICISLLGIAFAMNNFIAICGAALGVLFSLVGCFIKDR